MPCLRRFVALLRRRAWPIAAFVLLLIVFDGMRAWSLDMPEGFLNDMFTQRRANTLSLIGGAVLGPLIVEAMSIRASLRIALSVFATLLLVGGAVLLLLMNADGPITAGVREGRLLSNEAFLLRGFWFYAAAGLLFAAYCQTRDRELDITRAAQAAELARADSQRDIVASRLQVLQARVEPELLFDALGDVKLAYLRDPAAAGALLDDLIAYLRAALPQMRGGHSTLLREAALAEAYLKVVPAGRSGQLVAQIRIADAMGDAPFPPMVLLPLAHAASEAGPSAIRIVAPCPETITVAGTRSIEIRTTTTAPRAEWDEPRLAPIRGVLQQYYGDAATLRIERIGDDLRAVVTWPAAEAPAEAANVVTASPA